jgi:hypothetical protein
MRLVSRNGNVYIFDPGPDPLGQRRGRIEVTELADAWNWQVQGGSPALGVVFRRQVPEETMLEQIARIAWGCSGSRNNLVINFVTNLGRNYGTCAHLLFDDCEVVGVSEPEPGFHRALEALLHKHEMPRKVIYWPSDFQPLPSL